MSHVLIRTSVVGAPFVGRCIKCGTEGLRISDELEDCPADDVVSDEQALIDILKSEPYDSQEDKP